MSAAIVKAIRSNLSAIITSTMGYQLHENNTDPTGTTTPIATLEYAGEEFLDTSGFRKNESNIRFTLEVNIKENDRSTGNNRMIDIVHDIRANVTVNALNVGSLATSKDVNFVQHLATIDDSLPPSFKVIYTLTIRYKES